MNAFHLLKKIIVQNINYKSITNFKSYNVEVDGKVSQTPDFKVSLKTKQWILAYSVQQYIEPIFKIQKCKFPY